MSGSDAVTLVWGEGPACGWSFVDKYGELYPCDQPSIACLINGPEEWEGWFCGRHAGRARSRAQRQLAAERE